MIKNKRVRKYREKHPDRYRAYINNYRKTHPDKYKEYAKKYMRKRRIIIKLSNDLIKWLEEQKNDSII